MSEAEQAEIEWLTEWLTGQVETEIFAGVKTLRYFFILLLENYFSDVVNYIIYRLILFKFKRLFCLGYEIKQLLLFYF